MQYTSTRNQSVSVSSAQAIARGIAADGGLFVPQTIPVLAADELAAMAGMSYPQVARSVLARYLTDYSAQELTDCVNAAYIGTFDNDQPAPLVPIGPNTYAMELWHGPTCAFKDLALQILPHLLTRAGQKTAPGETKVILVATSGDTGKAALAGFANVPGVKILVFYPSDGVSAMQQLQMTTQQGDNVGVCAIRGNFDDAQTGVKAIFTDPEKAAALAAGHMAFSSANSINWGRLAPQIVYYINAYATLLGQGTVAPDQPVNVVVPTGNFGNILAAYYAKRMGLPVGRLICASNRNRVLTDFIRTGTYDRNRDFYTTLSPSMDILISSNLERLLYHVTDGDRERVNAWMTSLKQTGRYTVDASTREAIAQLFWAGTADDAATQAAIGRQFAANGYLADPHTGVALDVARQYTEQTGDQTVTVVASTASPFKFSRGVLQAIGQPATEEDEFALCRALSQATGWPVPASIAALQGQTPRFTDCCEKQDMWGVIARMLAL